MRSDTPLIVEVPCGQPAPKGESFRLSAFVGGELAAKDLRYAAPRAQPSRVIVDAIAASRSGHRVSVSWRGVSTAL